MTDYLDLSNLDSIFAILPRDCGDSASLTRTKLDAAISGFFPLRKSREGTAASL